MVEKEAMLMSEETKHKDATRKSFFVCDCVQVHHHGKRQHLVLVINLYQQLQIKGSCSF